MLNFILAFSLLSLLNPFSYVSSGEICIQTKMGGKANSNSAKMIEEKYHIRPCGSGMKVNAKVEGLYLSFDYYGPDININEARSLLMNITKDHYQNIKDYEQLKPYLIEPFTLDNITVSIFFHTKDGQDIYHPHIAIASFFGNIALFVTSDKFDIFNSPAKIKEPTQYFFDVEEGRLPPPVYKELQK